MMVWILLAVCAALAGAFLLYYLRTQTMLAQIDAALDAAIAGKLDVAEFNETQGAKLTAKLAQHLMSAKLRQTDLLHMQSKTRELISDISHQTKTALSNIILNAQLLEEQPELSENSKQLAVQLDQSAEKLSFLIQSLIKVSRLESGTIAVKPVRQDLYELAGACVQLCGLDAAAKGVALELTAPEHPVFAQCDFNWCREAVVNILDNAIKYTPAGGRVTITLFEYELFACIRISDTGKGILETDLPKIFGRFYRAASSANSEGVGLGLYLAREIIQQCKGYIQVSSAVGGGSVFSVYLSKL